MAKIIENDKGFKVIHCNYEQIVVFGNNEGRCSLCCEIAHDGYYVAATGMWMCRQCYRRWMADAVYDVECAETEERNFEQMRRMLNI